MTRQEFMEHLQKLLWDISQSEREEALQYYNDYFDDAGAENEEAVLKELGSPIDVAKKIKAGFCENTSEYSEKGYEDTRFRNDMEMIMEEEKKNWKTVDIDTIMGSKEGKEKNGGNGWKVLAIILLCVFLFPVIVPLAASALLLIFSFFLGVILIVFGVGVAGIAILFSGLIFFGAGVAKLLSIPAVGLALAGVGCILFALGLIITLAVAWGAKLFIPWFIRGIVALIRIPFSRRKAGVST